MADLQKELIKSQNKMKVALGLHDDGDDSLKQVRALLEYRTLEDNFILSNLGINSKNAKIEENKGKLLVMESIEKAAKFTVIHIDNIKELCMKYRLRFLPTMRYTGAFPPDITTEIKELEKNKAQSHANFKKFDEFELKNHFFVLAPPSMFKLDKPEKVDKPRVISTRLAEFQRWLRDEPILFYKEDETHFVLLKKWGDDFTIFRRILGLFTSKERNFFILNTSVLLLASLSFNFLMKANIGEHLLMLGFSSLIVLAISAILSIFTGNIFTDKTWNSTTK